MLVRALVFCTILLFSFSVQASTVTYQWNFDHGTSNNNMKRFKIYVQRNCSGSPYFLAIGMNASSGSFTQQYTDTTLSPQTLYCIYVSAINEAGLESSVTNTIRFTTK